MEMKIKDVVNLLQVSEKTVYRWIKDNKIPCYRIQHQYRFSRAEINEWVLSNKIPLSSTLLDLSLSKNSTNFTNLLQRGGVHVDVPGQSVAEVLHNALQCLPTPENVSTDDLARAMINREQMMSTAIGHGIAIPHPRNPMITNIDDACAAICFLKKPLDFGELDGQLVHTLFVLLTFSPRRHLEVLSKISYLCQIDSFRDLLEKRAEEKTLLAFIRTRELTIKNNMTAVK